MDLTFWLIATCLLFIGTVGPVTVLSRRWWALRTGRVRTAVWLSGPRRPYPAEPVRGRMTVTDDRLTWSAAYGAGVLDLSRTGLWPRERTGRFGEDGDDRVFRCTDGTGAEVTLTVRRWNQTALSAALFSRPRRPSSVRPSVRRRRWGFVVGLWPFPLLAASVALCGGIAYAMIFVEPTWATVLEHQSMPNRTDSCIVQWFDEEWRAHVESVTCAKNDVEPELPVIVLGGPLEEYSESFRGFLDYATLTLIALGAAVTAVRRRRRYRSRMAPVLVELDDGASRSATLRGSRA